MIPNAYVNKIHFKFPSTVSWTYRSGSTTNRMITRSRTTNGVTQWGLFVQMQVLSVGSGYFASTTQYPSTTTTTDDGVTIYHLEGNSGGVSDTWLLNHFGTLPSPLAYAADTVFQLPWIESSTHCLSGVQMPAINATALTAQTDLLGDIPASFRIQKNVSGKIVVGDVLTTTNATGRWVIDDMGDGSITATENTPSTSLYPVEYDALINCSFVARYVINPVITAIDYYVDSANLTTNVVYTTGDATVRRARFIAPVYNASIPWE